MGQHLSFEKAGADPLLRQTNSVLGGMLRLLRLALGLSALLAFLIDPPDRLKGPTLVALALYVLYGGGLYFAGRVRGQSPSLLRHAYWLDVAWYLLLIGLGGTGSVLFIFFFFPVLAASFTGGLAAGLRVCVASALLFTAVSFVAAPDAARPELNRLLVRPISLMVIGATISYWGGLQTELLTRLALLREIGDFSNPRFGVDRTLGFTIEKIRAHFGTDRCLLLLRNEETGGYTLRHSSRKAPEGGVTPEEASPAFAAKLLSLPERQAVIYNGGRWALRKAKSLAAGDGRGELPEPQASAVVALADLLDAQSFLSVPVSFRTGLAGRFFLLSSRARTFSEAHAAFVTQTLNYIIPIIENIRLVDELASAAADQERQKIARDLHDSVIQPYIGLRIGLTAVHQKAAGGADVAADVARLIELTETEIGELRSYMRGLKGERTRRDNLLPAVRRFAAKFSEATQIELQVRPVGDFRLNDRLAAEVFQLVAEGMSNIRRHTMARRASLTLEVSGDHFCLDVENEGWPGASGEAFTPRSISERVHSLGGTLDVRRRDDGGTRLEIKIPL